MMKRAFVMALVVVMSVLAALPSGPAAPAEARQTQVLEIYIAGLTEDTMNWFNNVAFPAFEADHPGVDCEIITGEWGDFDVTVAGWIATGEGPEILQGQHRPGRRRVVFIRGLEGQWDSKGRETAFAREVMRYNLHVPPEHMLRGDFSAAVAARSLEALIASGAQFDAVLAADYLMGIAAVETLRRAGYAVPEGVSVVGFGDALEAEAAGLTTVAADVAEQGRRAARQLIRQIEGLPIRGMTVLSVRLVIRDTSLPGGAALGSTFRLEVCMMRHSARTMPGAVVQRLRRPVTEHLN